MALFRASCAIDAPPPRVWAALLDWEATRAWMTPPTEVTVLGEQRDGVGTRLRAVSSVAGIVRLVDHMVVTEWVEGTRLRVRHAGRLVRGDGIYLVEPDGGGTRFTWIEDWPWPLGVLGEVAARILRPVVQRLMRRSCCALGRLVTAG